jgi:hypothetical protein
MKKLASVLCFVCLFISWFSTTAIAVDDKLTNSSVIEMHKLGLGDGVVIEKIKASTCDFDTGVDALKKLKDEGIADAVIQAMVAAGSPNKPAADAGTTAAPNDPNDPKSLHPVGIYLFQQTDGQNSMTKVEPSAIEKIKSSGGVFAIYGEETKHRAQLATPHADLQIHASRPTFYFYFAVVPGQESSAPGPEDFILAEFQIKKDTRRLVIGKSSLYGKAKTGVDPKAVVGFTSEKIAPGIYKATPSDALADGEYCFLLGRSAGSAFTSSLGTGGELYCFGVQSGIPAKKK